MNISNFDKSSKITESIPFIEEKKSNESIRKRSSIYSQDVVFIVIGATGRLGALITEILVGKGIRVIAIVKDTKKLYSKLQEHIINRLENIIEIDYSLDSSERKTLIEKNDHTEDYVIINALEIRHKHESYCKILKSYSNLLEDLNTSKITIKRFIMISSNLANYPFSFRSYIINLKYSLLLEYRQRCERLVKSSGLNYLIIRPDKIINEIENGKFNEIYISQDFGKFPNCNGIGSFTLSRLIVDVAFDKWIPDSCSFYCTTSQEIKEYSYIKGSYKMKSDRDYICKSNRFSHLNVFYFYNILLLGLISGGVLGLVKIINDGRLRKN